MRFRRASSGISYAASRSIAPSERSTAAGLAATRTGFARLFDFGTTSNQRHHATPATEAADVA